MQIIDGETAARLVLQYARKAGDQGSFGVGGLMIDKLGRVIATAVNQVMRDDKLEDPTAHCERQLIDWYWTQRNSGRNDLPEPSGLTIVSSLDPCLMCAGSILQSGFSVISMMRDNSSSICATAPGNFVPLTLPGLENAYRQAKMRLNYAGIDGVSAYIGGNSGILTNCSITREAHQDIVEALHKSADRVKKVVIQDTENFPMNDPKKAESQIHLKLAEHLLNFGSQPNCSDSVSMTEASLPSCLVSAARISKTAGGQFDSAALLGPYGDVLMLCGDATDKSPIRTPLMEVVRNYIRARTHAPPELASYLPHPKNCTFVSLRGPNTGNDAGKSLMEFGAFGSFMRMPSPERQTPAWQYVLPCIADSLLEQWCVLLPPLYQRLKVRPTPASTKWHSEVATALGQKEACATHRSLCPSHQIHRGVESHICAA